MSSMESCFRIRYMILGTADKVTESREDVSEGGECFLLDWREQQHPFSLIRTFQPTFTQQGRLKKKYILHTGGAVTSLATVDVTTLPVLYIATSVYPEAS